MIAAVKRQDRDQCHNDDKLKKQGTACLGCKQRHAGDQSIDQKTDITDIEVVNGRLAVGGYTEMQQMENQDSVEDDQGKISEDAWHLWVQSCLIFVDQKTSGANETKQNEQERDDIADADIILRSCDHHRCTVHELLQVFVSGKPQIIFD